MDCWPSVDTSLSAISEWAFGANFYQLTLNGLIWGILAEFMPFLNFIVTPKSHESFQTGDGFSWYCSRKFVDVPCGCENIELVELSEV